MYSKHQILTETIRRLARRGNVSHLRNIVHKTRAEDLAHVFGFLGESERSQIFRVVDDDVPYQAELVGELEEELAVEALLALPPQRAVEILRKVPNDDVADILGAMEEEQATALLDLMKDQESEQVSELMQYGDDTAGGIMSPDFFALPAETTTQQAIDSLRESQNVEMAMYVYVVDEDGHLVGVCSLRQLVTNRLNAPLGDIMEKKVIRVSTETDQEEVARLTHRYGLLAIPVVDEHNLLVGVVTVDDVIDVIREEATEDILKMAGVGEDFGEEQTALRAVRNRLPWLLAAFVGGVGSVWVIGAYEATLSKVAVLATFIPVIMGMGGNIGNQAATLVVRGLALGRIELSRLWHEIGRQCLIGIILGVIFGGLLAAVAYALFRDRMTGTLVALPLVVGLSVFSQMLVAAFIGTLLPMIFARLRVDPAVATGPFVTTSMDIIGVVAYFNIAVHLLRLQT